MTFPELDDALALRAQYEKLANLQTLLTLPDAAASLLVSGADKCVTQALTVEDCASLVMRWQSEVMTRLAKLGVYPAPQIVEGVA
jgi:hypothetical protein